MIGWLRRFRQKYHILAVSKDGGPASPVTAYWLFEWKSVCSVGLLRFDTGARDVHHTRAFHSASWLLWGHGLVEHRIDGPGANVEEPYVYVPGPYPIITLRSHLHKVISLGRNWVLTFRGPWADYWKERHGRNDVWLTHGREPVGIDHVGSELCDFERELLQHLVEGNPPPWGAAVGAAGEALRSSGLITRDFKPTPAGVAYARSVS